MDICWYPKQTWQFQPIGNTDIRKAEGPTKYKNGDGTDT
jgi:hypothetical protein